MNTTNTTVELKHMAMVREQITKLTKLTSEQIFEMQIEAAYNWLRHIGCDDVIANQFMNTAQFWGFFKTLWHRADVSFLHHYYAMDLGNMPRFWYDNWHATTSQHMNTPYAHVGYHTIIKTLHVKR